MLLSHHHSSYRNPGEKRVGTNLVETESNVITVQPVSVKLLVQQVLFEGSRNGRLCFRALAFPPNKTVKRQEQLALPEALKPVSQTVQPFWPRRVFRSSCVTAPEWGELGPLLLFTVGC